MKKLNIWCSRLSRIRIGCFAEYYLDAVDGDERMENPVFDNEAAEKNEDIKPSGLCD